MVAEAMTFLANTPYCRNNIIIRPISLLQRHFRLGYSKAWELARAMELKGLISIVYDHDGTRLAMITATTS